MRVDASTKCCARRGSPLSGELLAPALLQRLAHLAVQAHPARSRELAQEGLLHQGVSEAVASRLLHLLDHPRLEPLLDQPEECLFVAVSQQGQGVVVELAAGDRTDLEKFVRLAGDQVQPSAQGLSDAVRDADVGH